MWLSVTISYVQRKWAVYYCYYYQVLRDGESQVLVDDCFRGRDAGYLTLNVLQSISTPYPSRCVGNTVNRQLPWLITDLNSRIHSKQIITLPSLLLLRIKICSFFVTAVGEGRKDLWAFCFLDQSKVNGMGARDTSALPTTSFTNDPYRCAVLFPFSCSVSKGDFLSGSFSWPF